MKIRLRLCLKYFLIFQAMILEWAASMLDPKFELSYRRLPQVTGKMEVCDEEHAHVYFDCVYCGDQGMLAAEPDQYNDFLELVTCRKKSNVKFLVRARLGER